MYYTNVLCMFNTIFIKNHVHHQVSPGPTEKSAWSNCWCNRWRAWWIGIQQVMALQDPRLYTAHLWILPVPRPARTFPNLPLIFASSSSSLFLRSTSTRFDVHPLSNIFPFLFPRILRVGHVLADVANRFSSMSFGIHERRGFRSEVQFLPVEPLSNL